MYNTNTSPYYVQPPRPAMGLKGRPVSSLEEARASGIDFDGSVFYFPDLANKRIYTKQINLDGTATLNMYELKELPSMAVDSSAFITRQEFNEAMEALRNSLIPAAPQPEAGAVPAAYNF